MTAGTYAPGSDARTRRLRSADDGSARALADYRTTGSAIVGHRRDRIGTVIVIGATVIGVWFGFAGPSQSPVVPDPIPVPTADVAGIGGPAFGIEGR
jgi:hypothetical protein